jgi:ATP-dependent DNA ligase
MPPVSPMLAKAAHALPGTDADDLLFEPKWDGFRCIVFRDGDEVELGSRNERPLTRYFPELVGPIRAQLPERCVLDGELVVGAGPPGATRLDFDLLSQRIHPAASRIARLAEETPASFVAFDLLALGDRDLTGVPLRQRRAALEEVAGHLQAPLHLTPATTDRHRAAEWFERFEGAGLDGVLAKDLDGTYQPGKRAQVKVKHQRTADCVVAGYRPHKDGAGVGSLLLGLFDDDGTLHHVGVAASFSAARRAELVGELAPYRDGALADHPWQGWAEEAGAGRMPGAPSRWNGTKDLSWSPLRIELVCEVAYEHLLAGRFRHTTRFQRWRPDKAPRECTYAQLEQVPPYELTAVLGAS